MAIKENCVTLCWPNWVERGTLSGGNWKSSHPLSNLTSPIIASTSRSDSLDLEDTQFSVSFDIARPVGAVALMNHNLSAAAQWRVTWWFDESQTELARDGGWKDVWPAVFASSELEWEYDNFWSGTISQDDVSRFTTLAVEFSSSGSQIVRGVRVEVDDQNNEDGYIKIGRVMMADIWQPRYSAQYGIEYGYDVGTTFETADNREQTLYADVKTPKRTVSFNLATLDSEEGFRRILTLQRDQGIHREILYTEGVEPSVEGFQKMFVGRLQDVSPLSHPYFRTFSNSINLVEIL